jgi:tetratricopeptide (TPR) repeat protein
MRFVLAGLVTVLLMSMTQQANAACSGRTVFLDEFDDNLTGWLENETSKIENGQYAITSKPGTVQWPSVPGFYFDVGKKVQCIEANIDIPDNGGGGVIFWQSKPQDRFLSVYKNQGPQLNLITYRFLDGKWNRLKVTPQSDPVGTAKKINLRIILDGGIVTVFVNDKEIHKFRGQAPDGSFQIGLLAENLGDSAQSTVAFDNLRVTEDTQKDAELRQKSWATCTDQEAFWLTRTSACAALYHSPSATKQEVVLAYLEGAKVSLEQEIYDGAIRDYEKVLQLEPANDEAAAHLAPTYLKRAARLSLAKKFGAAIDDYERVLELDPSNADATDGLSKARTSASKAEQALARFTEMIARDPANSDTYAQRGKIHEGRGEIELAMVDYVKVIELKRQEDAAAEASGLPPRFDFEVASAETNVRMGLERLASQYTDAEAFADAVRHLTTLIDLFPKENVDHLENRASAFEKWGKRDEATADYQRALSIDPSRRLSKMGLRRLQN